MGADASSDNEAASWLFESTLDVLLVLSDSLIQSANPSWRALTGWTDAEALGCSYLAFVHPDESELLNAHVARLNSEGMSTCEHRILRADGDWMWVRSRTKLAADGRALAVLQDITAERRRAAEQAKAAWVVELLGVNAGIYLWRYDPVAQEYDLNPLMEGRDRADPSLRIAAGTFQSAIHPEDRGRVDPAWARTLANGEMAQVEYRYFVEGAGWRRMRTAWHGLEPQAGGDWEVLGVSQDVTELSDARDAALEAAEVKSRFLANMSHEIRTPMNGVLGVLHLLRSDSLTVRNRALVDQALGCGTALAQLLQDIVDFTGIEAGSLELAPEPTEVANALDAVVAMLRPDAEGRGLTLEASTPRGAGWASLDPLRLRQILLNLVGNAVKFTLRGGVKVKLTTRGAGPDQMIRIEVRDTGVGVPADAQAKLFERFQQADGSNTRKFGGMGLGLAVTKALVERMDGRIGFFSVEGEGSTFWVEVSAPVCAPPAIEAADASPWLKGLRVLVVEDNPTNRLVATRMLTEMGAEVETAENGAEGVARARAGAYDLIFMDIQMPVMDGVQAAREIRALPGPAGLTPIVATTANVLAHQVETYRNSGMDGCVAKPISPGALLGEIARLAGRVG
ncbi:MAG TPA: ATP-binding protein [Phenylobacterium sp.]|nr:ATP-binding protein [Phenylobacterium sp.]